MLSDSGASWVLCQEHLMDKLPERKGLQVLSIHSISKQEEINTIELPKIGKDQLAYVIYTSGSAGQPKGVPISHLNLIHSTTARLDFYAQSPSSFLLLSSFSFDSSVVGIFWTICSGGTLVLPKQRIEQDLQSLADLMYLQQTSHTLMLPSLYALLLTHASSEKLGNLQTVIVAGEACPPTLVQEHFRILPGTSLYNEYGPTEASVWCIAHQVLEDDQSMVPIGRPINNTKVYILDKHLQPVPIGVPGELYIAGTGLASGYLNRPELTKERFLPAPFGNTPEARMYKTGDLARYDNRGIIEFLGRADEQVKIRGHRVEPDEISAIICQYPNAEEAIVIARATNNSNSSIQLIGYLTGMHPDDLDLLRQFLKGRLPDYMIPAALIPLDHMPHLPNGKIDRKALPEPDSQHFSRKGEYLAPSNELEKQLAGIWQEVLHLDQVGLNDNFFDIGGDSLLSIQVVAKAREKEIPITATQLFEFQTLGELANSIATNESPEQLTLVPLQPEGKQLPLFCIHSGGAHVFFYKGLAKYIGTDQPLYALQPKGLDCESEHHQTIEEMAAHYLEEIREVQPHGPYRILGTCFSNAVALEMANQLNREEEAIDRLFIIDSGPTHLFGDIGNGKKATFIRFWDMLTRGDWHRIVTKIKNRIKPEEKAFHLTEETEAERELLEVIQSLNKAYGQYHWVPYSGKIHFIRSTEFHYRRDKKFHLQQWKKLAKEGLEVHVVPGHHLTLFQEPEVEGLAQKLKECMGNH